MPPGESAPAPSPGGTKSPGQINWAGPRDENRQPHARGKSRRCRPGPANPPGSRPDRDTTSGPRRSVLPYPAGGRPIPSAETSSRPEVTSRSHFRMRESSGIPANPKGRAALPTRPLTPPESPPDGNRPAATPELFQSPGAVGRAAPGNPREMVRPPSP